MSILTIAALLWAAAPTYAQDAPADDAGPAEEGDGATAPQGDEAVPKAPPGGDEAAPDDDGSGRPQWVEPTPAIDPAELDALRARLDEQQELLDEQQLAIDALGQQLTQTKLKLIPKDVLKADVEGHYRVRGYVFNHLYESQMKGKKYLGDARYMQQRLVLRPTFNYRDLAQFWAEFRALDGVVFGDNQSISSTALFANNPSSTTLDGFDKPTVNVSKAWMQVSLPVGVIRAGRQPSHWGMGLLAHDGDRFDYTFGEAHYGNINDRILFATRPIAIGQAAAGKDDSDIPFFLAVGVDRMVEDPLVQFHGYKCEEGLSTADEDFDPRCDLDGDGITDQDHSWESDRVASDRRSDWWADQSDDVLEMVYVAIYRGDGVDYFGATGDLHAGAYLVTRSQKETESNAVIVDTYFKMKNRGILAEFEAIHIAGKTRAITLQSSQGNDPIAKTANVQGYAARLGYEKPWFKAQVETGYAKGDEDVTDKEFTGRALNPDHNVGLLLYEEVISRVTSEIWTDSAQGLWSQGGVYNSRYVFPTVHIYPLDNWELVAGYVGAWPDRPDGAIIRCRDSDKVDCALPSSQQAESRSLGYEVDLGVHHRWHEHVLFALEGGFAKATDRLPLESAGLNPEGKFFTVQSRLAFEF